MKQSDSVIENRIFICHNSRLSLYLSGTNFNPYYYENIIHNAFIMLGICYYYAGLGTGRQRISGSRDKNAGSVQQFGCDETDGAANHSHGETTGT